MNTDLINRLYKKYDIPNLEFGAIHDKLGDAYEEFLTIILEDTTHIHAFNSGTSLQTLEYRIFEQVLMRNQVTRTHLISWISATTDVPHRSTGGLPKTDIIARIHFDNGTTKTLTISSKQSTVRKVAMAEFDVETICREMNITNPRLKALMLKHQRDCSAINFTNQEKEELTNLLRPIARDFVRWVVTGCKDTNPSDVAFPTSMVKYKIKSSADRYNINVSNGDFEFLSFSVFTMEEYIDTIMYNRNGTIKSGGFGTGLSWTYATGSGNTKIQFKG